MGPPLVASWAHELSRMAAKQAEALILEGRAAEQPNSRTAEEKTTETSKAETLHSSVRRQAADRPPIRRTREPRCQIILPPEGIYI